MDFVNWLEAELNKREWSQSDLARKGKLTTAQVSRVLSRQSNPGLQFCKGVARAFDVTLESVLRHASITPPAPPPDAWAEEMSYKLRHMPPELRKIAEAIIETLRNQEKKGK